MHGSADHDSTSSGRKAWSAATLVVAAALFWSATSDVVYEATSPSALSWHVVLRKAYSVAAFALVGFMADRSLGPSTRALRRGALLLAAYSAAIEVTQWKLGSREGLAWNAIDVACGALGGTLGAWWSRIRRSRRRG